MVTIERSIDQTLRVWKDAAHRKVLLVRGARQVGKTHSVRALAGSFSSFLEVNFDQDPETKSFFTTGSLDPVVLLEKLGAYFGRSITPGKTLVFFDEIQECPSALSSLRFFHEQLPDLHVVAAGSLLEFALSEIPSFGVGRITSVFLYPLSFEEFLIGSGNSALQQMIREASFDKPLDDALHRRCVDLLRAFMLVGGLPEVASMYLEQRDLVACGHLLDSMLVGYEDDFAKYRQRVPVSRLRDVFRSVAQQAGQKFVFSQVNREGSSYGYRDALGLLVQAGLAYRAEHSAANGIPLGAEVNPKKFKALPFDVGIYARLFNLALGDYLIADSIRFVNSGSIAEVFAGLELIAHFDPHSRARLFYWHREAKSSNAEVDYVVQVGSQIIPIEVKAGTKGQMQSMHRFLDEKKAPFGVRVSLENFSSYDRTLVVPLYALGELKRLLSESPKSPILNA